MGRRRNKQNEAYFRSMLANSWDFTQYETMLTEIALARFKWEGLPDTCDARYLEQALLYNGKAIYFEDEVVGPLTLKVTLSGKFNVYGIPVMRQAYGDNNYKRKLSGEDSVLIWNTLSHLPTAPLITNFAMRLYDLDRTIDVNARAQKTPILITCEENERLSFENIYTMYDGNRPVIFGNKGLNPDNIKVLRTDAPYIANDIYQLKVNIWNEAMSALGVANVAQQKKERMVSSEINNLMGGTLANRYSYIEARQTAADIINKKFGTNITVTFRDGDIAEDGEEADELAPLTEDDTIDNSGGVDNE